MLARWDVIAPAIAGLALVVLALLPARPPQAGAVLSARQTALETAAPGSAVAWRDPGSGVSGTIIPAQITERPDGSLCRRYTLTVLGESSTHTACRDDGGTWQGEPQPAGQPSTVWAAVLSPPGDAQMAAVE